MLAYILRPSFNWDAAGMTDAQMEFFFWDLAMLGFCWHFITLAGFHCDALSIDLFVRGYAKRGAAAYVQLIQRRAGCMSFPDAVAAALKAKGGGAIQWLKDSLKMLLPQLQKAAEVWGARCSSTGTQHALWRVTTE